MTSPQTDSRTGVYAHFYMLKQLARTRMALRERAVVIEHGLQQHLRAGGALVLGGEFRLVVADAAEAGDEDHRGRGDAGNICGVVAGAGNHVARGQSAQRRGAAHRGDQPASKRTGG